MTWPALWIGLCAFLQVAGWGLSALGALNRVGYATLFGLAAIGWVVWQRRTGVAWPRGFNPAKFRRRFRHPFPLAFLVLAGLAFLGGLLHAPANYDALAYRIPRVLHWLAEERWHWIPAEFQRLNVRTCGIEWVSAPLMLFTGTDRWLFLINTVSFLLLPGLSFGLLTRLGVRARVAWHWMWLFPTGYCYLLQAGSVANDLFGAVFALAAVDFALRARQTGRVGLVWLALLAGALVTAAKVSNVVLGLPLLLALLPSWRLVCARPLTTLLVCLLAGPVSFLPTAVLNRVHCGDWTGVTAEAVNVGGGPWWLHLSVNLVLFGLHNLTPPVFPWAGAWNQFMQQIIPPPLAVRLAEYFEPAAAGLQLTEMQTEEGAGLGFGLSVLLLVTVVARWRARRSVPVAAPAPTANRLVSLGAWAAAFYMMSKLGLSGLVRFFSPVYGLLIPPLLGGQRGETVQRRRWWPGLGAVVFALAALLLVLSPARPLWPANRLLGDADAVAAHPLLRRAQTVYAVYGQRAAVFAPVLRELPADANPLGIISFDHPETSLWRPFGSRRILHVRRADTAETLRARGLRYVLASAETLEQHFRESPAAWQERVGAELVREFTLTVRARQGPTAWYLLRLRERPETPAARPAGITRLGARVACGCGFSTPAHSGRNWKTWFGRRPGSASPPG